MITLDKSGANIATLTVLNMRKSEDYFIKISQEKYLNNLIGQEHRSNKYAQYCDLYLNYFKTQVWLNQLILNL